VGALSPQEGTTSNRYAILGRIATGGMAEIFLARATSLAGVERYVVLKRILPERTRDPTFVKMFLDEARLAAQLQHPNIAQVHDIGRLGDSYFFTMEYVHGEDLRAILQRLAALRRLPPLNHALLVAAGAAAALHHAHERTGPDRKPLGIVHRDVSPSNVMVGFEGAVKLVDFGVAKASQRSTETRTGTVKGKIAYLSPEQCQGGGVDRRSDIFSLGIVLYELLTCTRLFKRETDFQTMTAIVNEPVQPPSRIRSDIAPEIDAVVLAALERDPARRFQTAGEMLEAIEAAAETAGKTMSAHALGRFLRELFGERPEPWVELDVRDDAPDIFTVTSQSVLQPDVLAGAPVLDRRATAPPVPPGGDIEAELRRTAQIRRSHPDDESGSSMPQVAPLGHAQWSGAVPAITPRPGRTSSAPPPMAGPPPLPPALPRSSAPSIPPPMGPPAVGSVPPPFAAPGPGSYPSYSSIRPLVPGDDDAPRSRWRSIGVIVGVAAVAIGISIGVYLARDNTVASVTPVAMVDAVALPPVADAAITVAAIDTTPDAPAVVAPPEEVAVDAAPVAPDEPPPDESPPDEPRGDPRAAALAAISAAANTGDWGDVWKACETIKRKELTHDARAACAQAACVKKRRADAIDLLGGLSRARRAAVEKVCKAKGVDVEKTKTGKDPCEIDPLSCQH
jgi:serine/threonine protein kinase